MLNFLPCDYMLPSTPCERPCSYRGLDRIVLGDDFSIGALEDKKLLFRSLILSKLPLAAYRATAVVHPNRLAAKAGEVPLVGRPRLGKRNSVKRDLDHATAA